MRTIWNYLEWKGEHGDSWVVFLFWFKKTSFMRRYTDKGLVRFVLYRGVQLTKWQAVVIYPVRQKKKSHPFLSTSHKIHCLQTWKSFRCLLWTPLQSGLSAGSLSWDKQHRTHYFPFEYLPEDKPFQLLPPVSSFYQERERLKNVKPRKHKPLVTYVFGLAYISQFLIEIRP